MTSNNDIAIYIYVRVCISMCMHTYMYRIYIYIHIIQQFSLIYVVFFLINVVKLCKALSKLDLPTLRKGSTEERTQWNK